MNAAVQPLQPMQNWVWGPVSLDALHAYVLAELLSLNWLFVSCVLNGLLDTNPIAWQMNKKKCNIAFGQIYPNWTLRNQLDKWGI